MRYSTTAPRGVSYPLAAIALLLCTAYTPASLAEITAVSAVQSLPTSGIHNWEEFTVDGTAYLVGANAYDGTSYDLDSTIYRWDGTTFTPFQTIATSGAADWAAFEIDGTPYLALANGHSATSYATDSKIYRWSGTEFVEYQSIPTIGAQDFEYFSIGVEHFLAVANYHNDASSYNVTSQIYRWNGTRFEPFQSIPTHGGSEWRHFTINGEEFLAIANAYNDSNYNINSIIYRWDGSQFTQYQAIPTHSAMGVSEFTIGNDAYLVFAEHFNGSTRNIDNTIYRWDGNQFSAFQPLPGHETFDWDYFTIGNDHYLAQANRSNGTTYSIDSVIYRWNGVQFQTEQTIPTTGALEWRYFTVGTVPYLAVANNYDGTSYNLDSTIYRLDATVPPIADFSAGATTGTTPLTVTLDASAANDPDGGTLTDYQWSTSDAQTATGPTATFTFTAAGSYSITLTVTDDEGASTTRSITVEVNDPAAPTACEGRAVYSAIDGTLQLPLMDVATVPLLGGVGRPAGTTSVPTTAILKIIPGTTLFEIESVTSATPDTAATATCHASYSLDGVLDVPMIDVPVVTAIGGLTVTTSVEHYGATLELLPMGDLFTLTGLRQLP